MPRNHSGKKRAGKDRGSDDGYFFQRRELLKLVTAITACGATHEVGGRNVLAQNKQSTDAQPLDAPSNSLAPAVHFQAAPGGTAALLEP